LWKSFPNTVPSYSTSLVAAARHDFIVGDSDVLLGIIGYSPFYISDPSNVYNAMPYYAVAGTRYSGSDGTSRHWIASSGLLTLQLIIC
jgi:hypothetical protein